MGLKLYRLDLPTALVASFTTLAESEAEAMGMISAAMAGHQAAINRVDVVHSQPLQCATQRRVRAAELGTPEEKHLRQERLIPAFAMIQIEACADED